MTFAPSEDSDQPGHPPSLIRFFSVRSMGSWGPSASSCGQRRRSDWADAQADLSLRWAHRSFCWFCHEAADLWYRGYLKYSLIAKEKLIMFGNCTIKTNYELYFSFDLITLFSYTNFGPKLLLIIPVGGKKIKSTLVQQSGKLCYGIQSNLSLLSRTNYSWITHEPKSHQRQSSDHQLLE